MLKKGIFLSILLIIFLQDYALCQENNISKYDAINIAAKEAYERNYQIDEFYLLQNGRPWEIYSNFNQFHDKNFSGLNIELNKALNHFDYWCVYFSPSPNTTEYDCAVFIKCTGEILYIWENTVREKIKVYPYNFKVTMGKAIEIADRKSLELGYKINDKYYRVKCNIPPWLGYPNRSTIIKKKYPVFYKHIGCNNYWSIRYFNINPGHDGGLELFVDAETGEMFFKANSFTFIED